MEAFESLVALTMEAEGLVVSEAQKFPVTSQTRKRSHREVQTHGNEVDLIGARRDRIVLATVKSYLGSVGVKPESVMGEHPAHSGGYRLLNDPDAQSQVLRGIRERFGYEGDQIELRLYTGKIAGGARYSARNEERIRQWCARQTVGSGPIRLLTLPSVASRAVELSTVTEYRDNPALVAIKVLRAAGLLAEPDTTE